MQFHFNFAQEWPVLIVIGLFLGFVAYIIVSGRRKQDKDQGQDLDKNTPKK